MTILPLLEHEVTAVDRCGIATSQCTHQLRQNQGAKPRGPRAWAYKGAMPAKETPSPKPSSPAKRRYGTGSIFEKRNAWYGQWRVRNRTITRKLGPIRTPGGRDGLTRKMAEARLRKLMAEVTLAPVYERMTVEDAGGRLIQHLVTRGRKASTTIGYQSYLRVHVAPFFGEKQIADVTKEDIERVRRGLPRSRPVGQEHAQLPRLPAQHL